MTPTEFKHADPEVLSTVHLFDIVQYSGGLYGIRRQDCASSSGDRTAWMTAIADFPHKGQFMVSISHDVSYISDQSELGRCERQAIRHLKRRKDFRDREHFLAMPEKEQRHDPDVMLIISSHPRHIQQSFPI